MPDKWARQLYVAINTGLITSFHIIDLPEALSLDPWLISQEMGVGESGVLRASDCVVLDTGSQPCELIFVLI